jgi:hypothetical protein
VTTPPRVAGPTLPTSRCRARRAPAGRIQRASDAMWRDVVTAR